MEQYQIRLSQNLTIDNLFDKLSLRSWMMIQNDLKPSQLSLNTYRKLSEQIKQSMECQIESYDVCGDSCFCNDVTLSKPLSTDWEPEMVDSTDKIYQLYAYPNFNGFAEEFAKDLANALKDEISFGRHEKVQTVMATVVKCVLADHIFWNSLCRVGKRAVCQPSCCSLML